MNFQTQLESIGEYGVVEEVSQPIITVVGLPGVHLNEIILFETGQQGQVFLVQRDAVSVLAFSKDPIKVGIKVTRTGVTLSVPVGESLLGAIIDPLGESISQKTQYTKPAEYKTLESQPSGIVDRVKITEPFVTGVTVIDMMVPLGKGQKQLIIGDRKTGKTSVLLSAIKKQVHDGAIAIYAAIGRKRTDIKKIQNYLETEKLADSSVIVATTSYDSPSLIFLTPFTAMTIAEYFRDRGKEVLVILDDLSTHAKYYREISLLAKRFPGRDSYPGDIFYTHARLLERAGNFVPKGKTIENGKKTTESKDNKEQQNTPKQIQKGVSITVLPIAEIIEGDFTGYIPTNLMGMTDGHIFFDSNVYYRGRRPAVNISLSVTRVGKQTQSSLSRSINREISSVLTLYDKVQNLSHFGAELTDSVKQVLKTGGIIYLFFNQEYSAVIPQTVQHVLFALIWLGYFNTDATLLHNVRETLITSYQDEKNHQFLDSLNQVATLNDFLANIQKNRDVIMKLAGMEAKSATVTKSS